MDKHRKNPLLSKIDFSTLDNVNFNDYYRNHVNYANQLYNIYYFNKINGFILSDDDDDNPLTNHLEGFQLLKDIQKQKQNFYNQSMRKYMAVYKIQQWWKERTMSPHYKIGRKVINLKYDEIFDF